MERFPDGAWVFYRPAAGGEARVLADQVLAGLHPAHAALPRDAERQAVVPAQRRRPAPQALSPSLRPVAAPRAPSVPAARRAAPPLRLASGGATLPTQ